MSIRDFIRTNSSYLWYYVIMMAINLSWSSVGSVPPLLVSLVYLVALITPVLMYKKDWFVAIFLIFILTSSNHYAPSFMPTVAINLFVSLLIACLLFPMRCNSRPHLPAILYFLIFYRLCVELFTGDPNLNSILYYSLIPLLIRYIDSEKVDYSSVFSIIFILVSCIIATEYIFVKSQFVYETVVDGEDLSRSEWTDSNYFGVLLGMGMIMSLFELFSSREKRRVEKYILIYIIAASFYAIAGVASRGAFLSVIISIVAFIFLANIGGRQKFYALSSMLIVLFVLYEFHVFDTLIARFLIEDGTAGSRTILWQQKLDVFFSDCSPMQHIFGVGRECGRSLGFGYIQGYHNDYVAFIIEYGFVGLLLFLLFLAVPLFMAKGNKKVLVCVIYMASVSMHLEPFIKGNIAELAFWTYTILLANNNSE